tara:strand:- start:1398 stop:1595 length:198 start_codon:yes stop_codon:yes gene_type:complete
MVSTMNKKIITITSPKSQLHINALQQEIEILKSKLQPHDTGHIHTAISVLTWRIEQIEKGEEVPI